MGLTGLDRANSNRLTCQILLESIQKCKKSLIQTDIQTDARQIAMQTDTHKTDQ